MRKRNRSLWMRNGPLWIAGLAAALLVSSAAHATGLVWGRGHPGGPSGHALPGVSLAELVDGGTLQSLDGSLLFSNFQAETLGVASGNLDRYRLIPTNGGFDLWAPLKSFFGIPATLALDYDVDAASGLVIDSISLSFLGKGGFGGAEADLLARGPDGGVAADLSIASGHRFGRSFFGHHHGKWHGDPGFGDASSDHEILLPPLAGLTVEELVSAEGCFFAKVPLVQHRFRITPVIPEPQTGLLLAFGLAGIAQRRRRGAARLRSRRERLAL